MKTDAKLLWGWIMGMMAAAGFWGIVFPQYMFTTDCVVVVEEQPEDTVECQRKEAAQQTTCENLYLGIGDAELDKIQIRCGILDWIGEQLE